MTRSIQILFFLPQRPRWLAQNANPGRPRATTLEACTRPQSGTGVAREQPHQFHGAVAVLAPSRSLVSSAAATRLARACTLPLSTLANHRGTRQPLVTTAKCGLECNHAEILSTKQSRLFPLVVLQPAITDQTE